MKEDQRVDMTLTSVTHTVKITRNIFYGVDIKVGSSPVKLPAIVIDNVPLI